jgi:2-polyprenyl-3-methyl-5-hydroxy-6-metoxy-1,4-benzoquinol methylase
MQFRYRSEEKEFLDSSYIKEADLFRNLDELDIINTRLGGYNASRKGLHTILAKEKDRVKTVLDIGFGGGDSIKVLAEATAKESGKLFFYGVDLKPECLKYAQNNLNALPNKELICDDYRNISPDLLKKVDIIHCSLFLHHLRDEEIIDLFGFCRKYDCILLVNDLHRHWLAYYSIKGLTRLFSRSYLVKNDAPISVKRGFKRKELVQLLEKSGYTNYSIQWSWAFRYILIATG